MYSADMTHSKSLPAFYKELRAGQEKHSGDDYCAVHDAIARLMKDCDSYKELGLAQGTTLAAAILQHPVSVEAIDNDLPRFNACRPLFEKYCKKHKIELTIREMSSLNPQAVSQADLLFIDTVHKPAWLGKELMLHQSHVGKYIVMHDTVTNGGNLHEVAKALTVLNKRWEMMEYCTLNVGYTVLKRISI